MDVTIDVYDDPALEILEKHAEEMPDFVKSAGLRSQDEIDRCAIKLIDKEGSVNKKYPIDSKHSTWVSATYFNEKHNNLSDRVKTAIASNIKEAADRFGIELDNDAPVVQNASSDEVDSFTISREKAVDPSPPHAKTASNFALDSRHKYPIDTEEQVKEATAYFSKYADQFDLDSREEYSENLVKRANELDVDIDNDRINKYASDQRADDGQFKLALEARKGYVSEKETKEALDVIFEKRANFETSTLTDVIKEFDKEAGIDKFWDNKFPSPQETVKMAEAEKTAQAQAATYNGQSVTDEDIKNIPEDKLEEHFDEMQIDELMNDPLQVFKALPKAHKEIIIKLV